MGAMKQPKNMVVTAKKRLSKLDKMTPEQKAAEAIKFWAAPDDATFPPETLAVVFEMSLPWFQLKRCTGGGIPYSKPEKGRGVFYRKADAIAYFNKRKMDSTSTPVSA